MPFSSSSSSLFLAFLTFWFSFIQKKTYASECLQFKSYEKSTQTTLLLCLVVAFLLVGVALVCEKYLLHSLSIVVKKLNMSEFVGGATIMSISTGAPELVTSILDVVYFHNNIGVGTVVGSAVFNILGVLGLSAIVSIKPFQLDIRTLARELFFFAVLLLFFCYSMIDGYFQWYESLIMVTWYFIYVILLIVTDPKAHNTTSDSTSHISDITITQNEIELQKEEEEEQQQQQQQQSGANHTRKIVLTNENENNNNININKKKTKLSHLFFHILYKAFHILSFPYKIAFQFTIPDCTTDAYSKYYLITLATSITWTGVLCWGVVGCISFIGCSIGVPPAIMGLTVLAVGAGSPEILSTMKAARLGLGGMAVSAVFGTNMFNFAIALCFPYFLKTAIINPGTSIEIEFVEMVETTLVLVISLACLFITLPISDWYLNRKIGFVLVFLYISFVFFTIIKFLMG